MGQPPKGDFKNQHTRFERSILRNTKLWIQFSIGIAIAVFFMWLFLRKVDWDNLKLALASARYIYLIPAILLALMTYVFRAFRWYYLLHELKRIHFNRLLPPIMIGFMGNALLPARAGEFIRAYLLSQKEKVKLTASLGTLVVDRLFDTLVLLILIAGVLMFYPFDEELFLQATGRSLEQATFFLGLIATSGFAVLAGFTVLLYHKKDLAARILEKVLFFLPHRMRSGIISLFMSFTDGLHIFKNWRHMVIAVLITIVQWIFNALAFYPLFYAFGIGDKLNVVSTAVVLASAAVGVCIPTPGYAGPFHFFVQIGLQLSNSSISSSVGAAFALVAHAVIFFPVVIIGILYAFKEGVSLGQIERTSESLRAAVE
ncbi:MAG: UPF0104 family protein [Candidatus Abyssobacteria bacterium SURF_5]|uniref:UPF0104 family protein n=1 Tax=Abyssobacteria bacterium (strain SURF_5) TaxID=2093360 RepID=A0A3A4NVD3_ABYX5|nr:MAG: UPF0104 family protein [Candidatus Abyssubacteria bacterium SURF_5]